MLFGNESRKTKYYIANFWYITNPDKQVYVVKYFFGDYVAL